MITLRMRRRRRLLDTYVRVELEERRTPADEHPLNPGGASSQRRSDASHVDPGAAAETGTGMTGSAIETAPERMPREARGATM